MRRFGGALGSLLVLAIVLLAGAPPASAEVKTVTYRQGPLKVDPYAVRFTDKKTKFIPSPNVNGHITGMHARVVDRRGRPIPIQRLMLHHVVYKNRGRFDGDRSDPVCGGKSESFYGTGEENQPMRLPPNYGYPIRKGDRWTVGWMLMNHRNVPDAAYIEYKATIDTKPGMAAVKPYWARATGCKGAQDPIFTVPGGKPPGSTYYKGAPFTVRKTGLLIAAGGHAHGGSKDLVISQPRCNQRVLLKSSPTYGMPNHPYYKVLPVLHEPGPINMTWQQTGLGIPVAAGEQLQVHSAYDAEVPHVRAMGIMHAYFHPKPNVDTSGCAPLPGDVETYGTSEPGRSEAPKVEVPLTGLDDRGKAYRMSRPPVPLQRANGNVSVEVRGRSFRTQNLSIPLGATVRWRFYDRKLSHNVTLASGPEGFASANARRGVYAKRFTKPGVYRNFCSLHPVDMTQAITVRGGKEN